MQTMATGATGPTAMLLGGGGLTKLIERLLPEPRRRGVREAGIRTMTIVNPKRLALWVSFSESRSWKLA
jgi:predicted metal-dependent phosphotriesterase family hydrolase